MNMRTFQTTRLLFIALVAVGLMATPSLAADFYLIAKEFSMTMPDGSSVPMWGFAADPTGACYNTTPIAARRTSPACTTDAVATVPGPRLDLTDTDPNLRIFLTNMLPASAEPVSIVIPGQEMPFSNATSNGPTWNDGSIGPRPSPDARVRSFGREANPNGGRQSFVWNNFRNNPFQPGTYLYQSGTHPQVQVQMGLYGAVSRNAAAGEVYSGVAYDAEKDLFFSEVDPTLHTAVSNGTFSGSTLNYHPKYFLLQSYDTSGLPLDVSIDPDNPTCIADSFVSGNRVLLRLYNAGLRELAPMMIGSHFDLVAEGGKPYPFPRTQYQTLLMPGSTKDAIFTPGYDGEYKLIERRLNLTDSATGNGGMQTCLVVGVGGGANDPPIAAAGGPYIGTAGLPIAFDGSGSSDPDGDTLSYSWDFGDGSPAGTGVTPSHIYAANGVYPVTLEVSDGVNPPVASPATTATVGANAPPTADPNGPYSGAAGAPIAFDGTGSSDPESQPLTYSWDFGDGNGAAGPTPSHTYAAAGSYTVTLTVNDGVQDSVPASTTASVGGANQAPTANPNGPYNGPVNTAIAFDGSGSSDPDGDPLTYSWNFGDGGTATGVAPTHTYTSGGTFTVTLVVNDGALNSAPVTTEAVITGGQPADTFSDVKAVYKGGPDRLRVDLKSSDSSGNRIMTVEMDSNGDGTFDRPLGIAASLNGAEKYRLEIQPFPNPNPTSASVVRITSDLGGTATLPVTID